MGRKTKLNAETIGLFCGIIRSGNTIRATARACQIPEATALSWLRHGRSQQNQPPESYNDFDALAVRFYEKVTEAEAKAETESVTAIRKAGEKNWQAHAWFLDRKWPERWGSQKREIRELQKLVASLISNGTSDTQTSKADTPTTKPAKKPKQDR